MAICPRCRREAPKPTAFCAGCGAPLLLGDEAAAGPLDAPLELERRRGGVERERTSPPALPRTADEAPGPAPARGALAALERSHWNIGAAAAAPAEAFTPSPDALAAGDALPEADIDALEVHVERAPEWRRAAAWAIDALPFAGGGFALGRSLLRQAEAALPAPVTGIDGFLDLLARERVIAASVAVAVALALAVYATLAHALAGATLGKWLLHLRVVGPDGARPSPSRSAVRSALAVASAAFLGLGFLLALFTRSGRALHDLLARTWVVKAP